MPTTRTNERATLRDELRRKFPGGPREALRKLGVDESLLDVNRLAFDGARKMPQTQTAKPNRLQYLVAKGIALSLNPLLAADAKVNYTPLFQGLNSKTLKARSKTIVADAKKLLKGKTIAKDADVAHLAHMLDQFEHVTEPKSLDESVSDPQHKAMEAAANGQSNLGIPKDVGKEFAEADRGKTFRDALPAFLKEQGMDEDNIKKAMDMLPGESAMDEDEEALDEDDEDYKDRAEDENAEDESEEEKKAREKKEASDKKAKDAKDKHAMDQRLKGMVTEDSMKNALKSLETSLSKKYQDAMEAREFVKPFVGALPMALDSADQVLRQAAIAMEIEDAEKLPAAALRPIIKAIGGVRQSGAQDHRGDGLGLDSAPIESEGSASRWGDNADRISVIG